jgi:hypothetical protein
VKQAIRALDIDDCARFARRVMEQSDPVLIREMVMGPAVVKAAKESAMEPPKAKGPSDPAP